VKDTTSQRYRANNEIVKTLEAEGKKQPDMGVKFKYTITTSYKFGGTKKKQSNSGGFGKAGRRKKRARR
jgi:hypothetical protein